MYLPSRRALLPVLSIPLHHRVRDIARITQRARSAWPAVRAALAAATYLYRIAHNLVYHYYRNRRRQVTIDAEIDTLASSGPLPEEATARWIREQQVESAMQELPVKCRTALVLRWRDGLRVAEIAEQMSLSQGMVKKYLATGIGHFRKCLNRYVVADRAA